MNLKKLLYIIFGIIFISSISAQPMPTPVKFQVSINGYEPYYNGVQIKNIASGEILTKEDRGSLKMERGVAFFDLADFKQGVFGPTRGYTGDEIEAKLCDVHPSCTYKFRIDIPLHQWLPKTFYIKVEDTTIPVEKYLYQCWDGTWMASQNECPIKQEPIIPVQEPIQVPVEVPVNVPIEVFVCSDGTKVSKSSECTILPKEEAEISDLWKVLIALAIIVLVAFGWGKGFTALANYYFKKGQELEKQGKKEEARKYYDRATKMLKTALKKAAEGKYKK